MPALKLPADVIKAAFSAWLRDFGAAVESGDAAGVADLFVAEDPYWRDILSLTWGYRTFDGRGKIEELVRAAAPFRPSGFRQAAGRSEAQLVRRSARNIIEGFFDFDTVLGLGTGFVRLVLDEGNPDRSRAWLLLTTLHELRGAEEKIGDRRPTGLEYSHTFDGDNWLDKRIKEQEHATGDPDVLVVGGGQAGLALGARLRHIGVDALIVEKDERIGDAWRKRYHSLTLHNEVWSNHMPYLPFPPTWPAFLPKDKLAGWLEAYAEFMELNTWTSTEFLGARYDERSRRWTATVRREGRERTLRVRHVVLASGVNGVPNVPELPGIGEFAGEVLHTSRFSDGLAYAGKRVLVVGTGNSGHDVAQDLYSNGAAEVTMMQRSPTCVVSLVPSGTLVYKLYSEGLPVEDIDLITSAIPYPVLRESYQYLTKKTCELDKDLVERLNAVGFETDFGADGTGFHMKYLRRGGGYYINVGCSDLIADGKIGLVQARDIQRFDSEGLVLADGRRLPLDVVVLATGYKNQQEAVRSFFGDEVADRVGPVWGFDDEGFMKAMWRRTGQDGFWLMGGSLIECRVYSRFLALQIKAELDGIEPPALIGATVASAAAV